MRGEIKRQPEFISLLSPESLVPVGHPIRQIRRQVDEVLGRLSPLFDEMYAQGGRPSIPPERLLKVKVLMALYSVRSERLFCEQLRYNLLFRWFLGMDLTEEPFVASTLSKNQERLLAHDVAKVFFRAVYELAREADWASDEHFTVDGTLIEAVASLKSFVPQDGSGLDGGGQGGNPNVDFHGQKRSNATHQSTTDPQARLYRKGPGKEARLYYLGHALMENRNGLLVDLSVHEVTATTETEAALAQLQEQQEVHGVKPVSVGADKNYHNAQFVGQCRAAGIAPHVAEIKNRQVAGLDGRTTRRTGYALSQWKRKQVEEVFGWGKTVGGLRRSRYVGTARTQMWGRFVGAAFNLVRMAKLALAPPAKVAAC